MSGSASIVWTVPLTLRFMRAMGACLPGLALGGTDRWAVAHRPRNEFAGRNSADALVSRCAFSAVIPVVFRAATWPQISDAIIPAPSVAMVDFSGRVLAMHVEPGEAVGEMKPSVDGNPDVPVLI